jgi:hypothetical protein
MQAPSAHSEERTGVNVPKGRREPKWGILNSVSKHFTVLGGLGIYQVVVDTFSYHDRRRQVKTTEEKSSWERWNILANCWGQLPHENRLNCIIRDTSLKWAEANYWPSSAVANGPCWGSKCRLEQWWSRRDFFLAQYQLRNLDDPTYIIDTIVPRGCQR